MAEKRFSAAWWLDRTPVAIVVMFVILLLFAIFTFSSTTADTKYWSLKCSEGFEVDNKRSLHLQQGTYWWRGGSYTPKPGESCQYEETSGDRL